MSEANKYLAILEQVIQTAREEGLKAAESGADYDAGKAMACYDIISTAIDMAEVMDIPLKDIGLADFDPDTALLRPRRKEEVA